MFEAWHLALLDETRVARLATVAPDGRPRVVPVCYAVAAGNLYVAVDEKPKRSMRLARITDIERDPRVTLLADRWDEDWSRLAWVRVEGEAMALATGASDPGALAALRGRYPQYASMDLESRPLICITPTRVTGWSASPEPRL